MATCWSTRLLGRPTRRRSTIAIFSLVFGQGRSDHANFAAAGVPSVFFTDANNGCYHTVLDDIAHVDRDKFYLQIGAAESLVDDLADDGDTADLSSRTHP